MTLKAHGHPGIPLHHAIGEEYLCDTCLYDADNSCTYPKRPYAKDCTLYSDRTKPVETKPIYSRGLQIRSWLRYHSGWLLLLGLLIISLIWAISQ
jgi:hypothetical protein